MSNRASTRLGLRCGGGPGKVQGRSQSLGFRVCLWWSLESRVHGAALRLGGRLRCRRQFSGRKHSGAAHPGGPRVTAWRGWTWRRSGSQEPACGFMRMPRRGAVPGTAWRGAGAGGTGNLLNWARREALPHPRVWAPAVQAPRSSASPARSHRSTVSALGPRAHFPWGF